MELALATGTSPSQWWDEDERAILTAVDILNAQAKAAEKRRRRRR